jgi:hypothetical protein
MRLSCPSKVGYSYLRREISPSGTLKAMRLASLQERLQGNRKQIKSPKLAPAWMPKKIWKPSVKKICVETLENI